MAPVYAAAIARVVYLRDREPLPDANPADLARYHERVYNTPLGAVGRTPDVLENLGVFETAIAEVEKVGAQT